MKRQLVRCALLGAIMLLAPASGTHAGSHWYVGPSFGHGGFVTVYWPAVHYWPPIHHACCCPWHPPWPKHHHHRKHHRPKCHHPPCHPCPPGHAAVYNGDRGQLVASGANSFVSIVWGKTLRSSRLKPLEWSDPNYDYFVEVAADGTDLPDDPPHKWAVSKCPTTSCGRHAIYFNHDKAGHVRWSRVQSARRFCVEVRPADGGDYDGGVGPDSEWFPTPPSSQADDGTASEAAATVDGAKLIPWAHLLKRPTARRVTAAKPAAADSESNPARSKPQSQTGKAEGPPLSGEERLPADPFRQPTASTDFEQSEAVGRPPEPLRDQSDAWLRVLLSSGFARK